MIVITVKFIAVEVVKYIRNEPLILKISFNDGSQERAFEKAANLDNIEEFSIEVMNEARKIEKQANEGNTGRFLDDVVMVRFGEDEEKTMDRLNRAFRKIKDEIKGLTAGDTPQNYLQKMAMLQRAKYSI